MALFHLIYSLQFFLTSQDHWLDWFGEEMSMVCLLIVVCLRRYLCELLCFLLWFVWDAAFCPDTDVIVVPVGQDI